MSVKEPKFWTADPDEERLTHDEIGDAVREWFDDLCNGPVPETLTVYGFAPMELPSEKWIADSILERILETLDEEHGDPDGDFDEPTDAMREAALHLAKVIRDEFRVCTCEQVATPTIRVADYVDADEIREVNEMREKPSPEAPR